MSLVTSLTPTLEFYDDNTAAWRDITTYLQSYTVSWGRRTGFEHMRARTCTLILDDSTRRFEPGYTAGAYYDGEPRQGSIINLYVTVNGTDYRLFYGTVESVTLHRALPAGAVATAKIVASDLLTLLAQDRLYEVTISGDYADNMVKDALTYVSWTTGNYTTTNCTAAGLVLQTYIPDGNSILGTIHMIADSEGFLFYVLPTNRNASCYLVDPWDSFSSGSALAESDLTAVTLLCDSDQIATLVRVTPQNHDIGSATYDKTGGTYESMWTLTSHGLSAAQEVWFPAIGDGAEPFEADTHYFAIVKTANIFQLATTAVNAAAGTYIEGTGDDSSGTWTLRVAGATETSYHPADRAYYGEWPVEHSGSLVPTTADAYTQAAKELDRRQKLFRLLRPVQMTAKIAVGDTLNVNRMLLVQPFAPITLTLDLVGAAREYDLHVQGGTIAQKRGGPLTLTAYTESADQWET